MKLSIIVPVHNDKNLIKSINSIIDNVGLDDYECFLVDGGSTNTSCKICTEFQKRNKHITYVRLNKYDFNEIRNVGLSMAAGEYVYFIEGKNLLCKDFLNEAVEYLDNNSKIDVYVRNYKIRNNKSDSYMSSYFENTEYGPILPMCVFRKSVINIKFQDYFCSDIIFSGKNIQAKHKYFFDANNYNSFIDVLDYKNEPALINYVKEFSLNWGEYVKREISQYTDKKIDLSYHVIDKCNKNCIACGHFSPLTPETDEGVSIEQFESDMKAASFLRNNVNALILTGGEPTMNKNLLELIKIALKYFDKIHLCSNGLNRQFFIDNAKFLNANKVEVFITRYNLDNFNDIRKVLNYVNFYTIPALEDENGKRTTFNCKHLSSSKVNIDRKYYCSRGRCTQLRDKKLYLCQYTANFHLFKNYFSDIEFPFSDEDAYIDLTTNKDIDKIMDFVFYHYPVICEYCRQPFYDKGIDVKTTELTKSKNELSEWYE